MSAPDTNAEKQERHHKPALLGIKGAMIFGVLMLLVIVFATSLGSPPNTEVDPTATMPAIEPAVPGMNAPATD